MSAQLSQEDEDLKRAIAESLGQIYTPQQHTTQQSNKVETNSNNNLTDWSKRTDFTDVALIGYLCDDGEVIQGDCLRQKQDKIFVHFNTDAGHYGKKHDWIPVPNERICPPPKNRPKQCIPNYTSTLYQNSYLLPQQPIDNTPWIAQNAQLFIEQSLVTYEEAVNMLLNINCCFGLYDKKIKQWRTAVFMKKWDNEKRLMVRFTQEANINPSTGSDKFLTIKDFPVNYIILNDIKKFNVKERDLRDMSNVPMENIKRWVIEKDERRKTYLIQKQKKQCEILVAGFMKDEGKKQHIPMVPPGLNKIIAHYCFLLFHGLPIKTSIKDNKSKEIYVSNFTGDWSKRTDFSGETVIGYLCDDGEVIQGDCLRQKQDKIFVHFNTDAGYIGKKYDWISVPNERICPPPKNRPKQRSSNLYGRHNYNNMDEEDDLQRAIAASLNDVNTSNKILSDD